MYNYGYNYTPSSYSSSIISSASAGIWTIIAFVLAIIGAFLVYFLFVKSNKKFPNKFLTWLKNFLEFQEMLIEPILKICYIFIALFITLSSFALISASFVAFLLYLIFGNLIARIIYELGMVVIGIWQNVRDINKKMK